ncbi:ABC transporter substrate-binding protein [Streptomyces sp. NPDC058664]|uniref:ABC transporter substrate-binding protein n=1 Tax=unclassified Streptomyces TaxID=2593676 RepID=UPI00364C70C7
MRRRTAILATATVTATVLATATGCAAEDAASAAAGNGTTPVTLALDWTPNTNHTGIYVAQQLGWFKDAGIDLKIVPYGSTAPETLIANHKADFGISYQEGVTTARAAGQDITSVYAVTQKTNVTVAVRADRDDIDSPKDLDGKTYAGFGAPYEKPLLQQVIRNDGGQGDFRNVTLNTSAYAALYAGKADFAMPMPTWEGLEAELTGKPLKNFQLADYGFPAVYSTLIASSEQFLTKNPALAKKFLAAVAKGYAYAATNPDQAADLLIKANKSVLTNPELVRKSEQLLAKEYYRAADGSVGGQSKERWQKFADFEFKAGLLTDANGKKLTKAPDASEFFTTDYLPEN